MSNDRLYIGLTVGIPAAVLVGVLVYTKIIDPIKISEVNHASAPPTASTSPDPSAAPSAIKNL